MGYHPYYDYGSAWIADEINALTNEIRYQRVKKEEEEFWREWTKQIILENNFEKYNEKIWKIIEKSNKWLHVFSAWRFLTWLFIVAALTQVLVFSVMENYKMIPKVIFPLTIIFYLIRSLVFFAYLRFSGLKDFIKLNGFSWGGQEGLVFKECKLVFKKIERYLWKRPYPWMPFGAVYSEICNKLYELIYITCDPNWLIGLTNIKLTKLLNNLQKSKQDLGGRIILLEDFQNVESPITLWKFNFSMGKLFYDEQSKFTYSFSAEDINLMKEELKVFEENDKSKNVF